MTNQETMNNENQHVGADDGKFKTREEGFDLPKLFLASCVQHVDQGVLSFDNTHLPIQIWSGGFAC